MIFLLSGRAAAARRSLDHDGILELTRCRITREEECDRSGGCDRHAFGLADGRAGPSAALAPRRYKLTVVSLDEWQGPSKQAYKITPAFLSHKEAGHSVISPAGVIVDTNVGSLILDELKSLSKLTAS